MVLDGRIDITADVTITTANVNQYERRLWFFDDSFTVTIEAETGLEYFGVYVRTGADTATLNSDSGSVVRFNNASSQVFGGRSGNILYAIRPDIYRTLLSNSIGVTLQDNDVTEGNQITTLNFDTNLNVEIENGVATIESLSGADPFSEPQRRFLSQLVRQGITLVTQQSGFDFGIFANPIDTVDVGVGSDLAGLNALNTNQFVADAMRSGMGFVYLLFQDTGVTSPQAGWTLVRTNAARDRAEYIGNFDDDFTEIPIFGASVSLFMSNNRIQYNPNDVIAVYTVTGGDFVRLIATDIDLSRGIPDGSISQAQLGFDITPGGTGKRQAMAALHTVGGKRTRNRSDIAQQPDSRGI